MILIGLGANLPGRWGTPKNTVIRAIGAIGQAGIPVAARSQLFVSAPLGRGGQGAYVNGVIEVTSHLPPEALLRRLHAIEKQAGRRRGVRWRSRVLDLDLLDWHGVIRGANHAAAQACFIPLMLPHPAIAARAFVLAPLGAIAPRWHHPVTGLTPAQMLKALPPAAPGRILDQSRLAEYPLKP